MSHTAQSDAPRARTARSLRPTIGLLTAGLRDPYATVTWSGVMEVAQARDANVVNLVGSRLHSPLDLEAPAQILFELVEPAALDGLVVFSEMLYHFVSVHELKRFLARYGSLPMTSIGLVPGIPSVMVDLRRGVREVVSHLINVHGFRRLAFLRGPGAEITAEAQYEGYVEGLAQFRIPLRPHLITPPARHWGNQIGSEGIRTLLDERGLRPGVDFQALVGCGDHESLAAIAALRERGWRVPADVAVTGFNNLEETRFAMPGVTTVDRQIADLSRQATQMLLDLLAGRRIPQRTILPPEVVVRRSCGCLPQTVTDAAVEISPAAPISFAQAHEGLGAAVAAAARPDAWHAARLSPDWADQLADSFMQDLTSDSSHGFLALLEEDLQAVSAAGGDVDAWHAVLSSLRRRTYPSLAGTRQLVRAENLWQQGRVLVGDYTERKQGRDKHDAAEQVERLSDITHSLITTFDVDGLMETLAAELPRLNISACYLSLYEDPQQPALGARLVLAYDERGRLAPPAGEERFPSGQLMPAGATTDRRRDLTALPLYFQGEQLGLVVLEMGPRDGRVYEALRVQISSALKGAMLMTGNARLYQEAVQARGYAEEANLLKSRFLSTVSHELRTPLSLIVGTIEMLLRERPRRQTALPAPYQRDLSSIHASAQHLSRLISDVLDLASSQAGELHLACEPLRLGEVLAQVDMLGEALAREKGLTWQSDVPTGLPVVWGDRTRLQQVALNLVSNAIKFTEQGYVRLWAEAGKQQVVVAITDSGMGISSDEQEFIFDEFRQSERAAQRGYGGMGLGLAISRRLVALHGGKIGVLSTGADGAGSTFYFTLPSMAVDASATSAGEDRTGTVLLLTERAGAGERLVEYLAARGFTVEIIAQETHPSWLGQILVSPPGAVVLDFEPAAEQWWELMQLLRRNPATQDIPVVFYELPEGEDHGVALELDFLAKPVAAAELARALARQGFEAGRCDGGRTILVVDDDPGILELHARLLEELAPKCRILKSHNGQEALELMARHRPDLVLLDLMMPVLDGFGVLEAMRQSELTRDVPVIVLTAQVLAGQDMARLQQGVAAVLNKGLFTGAEVLAQVTDALGRSKRLGGEAQRVVRQAMAYIHEHYTESFSREALAAAVGLNERYLTACFHQETGITPIAYLTRYRIQQARGLLERGELNITAVALTIGFGDPSYFARVFREEVGVTPRAYQRGERAKLTPQPFRNATG
jgi:signal transduction histidine kinase/DNA-binding LacI/PurR family transcriptional regulator/AraC-like DNA-binding protein